MYYLFNKNILKIKQAKIYGHIGEQLTNDKYMFIQKRIVGT